MSTRTLVMGAEIHRGYRLTASWMALGLLFATSANAFNIWTVNTTSDSNDGSCQIYPGTCSLRDAIIAANSGSGDTIKILSTGTITLLSPLPVITQSMGFDGPGANALTVSGNHAYQIFNINTVGGTVTVVGLTIANGSAVNGGGISVNYGTLRLFDTTLSGNTASGSGGGIYLAAGPGRTLMVTGCTFSANSSASTWVVGK